LRSKLWGRDKGAIEGRVRDLTASLELAVDPRLVVYVLMRLSRAYFDAGEPGKSIAAADEAIATATELGDATLTSRALAVRVAAEPLAPDAGDRTRQAILPLLRAGELPDALSALIDVGYLALSDGRLAEARELFEQALRLAPSERMRFYAHANLGVVYL